MRPGLRSSCGCSAVPPVRSPVLDAEAVQALVQADHPSRRQVHNLLEAASRLQRDVVVPAVTLAELYRGVRRTQHVDAALAPHELYLLIRNTDRALARLVGALLASVKLGSAHIADAHVAAVAVEEQGLILTGDPGDMERLVAGTPTVTVVGLTDSRT